MGNKKNKFSIQNESLNPYEKERIKILEANAAKMKAKGFSKSLVSKTLQEKCDMVSKNVAAELSRLEDEHVECQAEVQSKYIILEEAKEVVLSKIGTKWQNHKSNLKYVHFSEDAAWEEMWDKRPKDVPECQFKELLDFWSTQEAKEMSKRNKDNRSKQSDMHTMGPTSIAMLRHEMQQSDLDKRCLSQADLYIQSRKRKVARTYLTQGDETLQNIEKMKELQSLDNGSTKSDPYYDVMGKEYSGRLHMYRLGVTKSSLKNKDPKNPYILPPMLLDTISAQLEKKLEEADKRQEARFEQKLVAMLSKIREANPGVDLVIPDIPTHEGDSSSSHQN